MADNSNTRNSSVSGVQLLQRGFIVTSQDGGPVDASEVVEEISDLNQQLTDLFRSVGGLYYGKKVYVKEKKSFYYYAHTPAGDTWKPVEQTNKIATGVELVVTNARGNSIGYLDTTGTISWEGTVNFSFSDGTKETIAQGLSYSEDVEIGQNLHTEETRDVEKTVIWTYSHNGKEFSKKVTASVHQENGDTPSSVTYLYSDLDHAPSVRCTENSVVGTVTMTPVYTWASDGGETQGMPTIITDTASFSDNKHNVVSVTRDIVFETSGISSSIVVEADSYTSSSSTSYTSATAPNVECDATSNVVTVLGTTTTTQRWSSDDVLKSETTEEVTDTCNVTFETNCNQGENKTISGVCHDVSYSFIQYGDTCTDCTPMSGAIYANDNTLGGTRVLTVPGGTCTRYWQRGGNTCGIKTSQDVTCTVNPTCSERTFTCSGQSFTFIATESSSFYCNMTASIFVTGNSYTVSVVESGPIISLDTCGGEHQTNGRIDGGTISISLNGGGYYSQSFSGNAWMATYTASGPQTVTIAVNNGMATDTNGNMVILRCTDTVSAVIEDENNTDTCTDCVTMTKHQLSQGTATRPDVNTWAIKENCGKAWDLTLTNVNFVNGNPVATNTTKTIPANTDWDWQTSAENGLTGQSLTCD